MAFPVSPEPYAGPGAASSPSGVGTPSGKTQIAAEKDPPILSVADAQHLAAESQYRKVTRESIEAKIAQVQYLTNETMTICVITMANGYRQVGTAAPAHPGNFNKEVGRTYAFEDAFRSLWRLEGYLLCEQLAITPPALFPPASAQTQSISTPPREADR